MKIYTEELDISGLVISEEQRNESRTPGIHVSDVLKYLSELAGENESNDYTREDLDKFALVGRLWEQQLSMAAFPKPRYERIGEIECDGIIGSPDALDTHEWALHEYKVAWGSSKLATPIDLVNPYTTDSMRHKFRSYLLQCQAYCHMLGLVRAELVVFHVNGPWRPPLPTAIRHRLLFTPGELEATWMLFKMHAEALRGMVTK